jgi:phosphatidylinositol glycan class O
MVFGVGVMALGLVVVVVYAAQESDDGALAQPDAAAADFNFVTKGLEMGAAAAAATGKNKDANKVMPYQTLHRRLLTAAAAGCVPGALAAAGLVASTDAHWSHGAGLVALASLLAVLAALTTSAKLTSLVPTSPWGWLAVVLTLGQSAGFSSNSYTVWEDTISLFFVATFGFAALVASFRLAARADRMLAVYHSVMLMALPRVASLSRLCRDEQMPYCVSTYYASSASSTSAPWQLAIPFVAAVVLPSVVRSFLAPTRSYEGQAPALVGLFFRGLLLLAGAYWVFDAADNDGWVAAWVPDGALKAAGVWTARAVLALALVAGTTTFMYAPPPIDVSVSQRQIVVLGFANASGARYLLLPLNIVAAAVLVSKPMGGGALAVMLWQVLTLVDLLDLLALKTHPVGAVVLGLLGNVYFFATGHQAVLSTIQWDSAFVPLYEMRYPWSPLMVALNTFAGHVVAVACAPLLVLWKAGPRRRGALELVARRALAPLVAYFAAEALASMACAGWHRRHLMLFRVFGPRFMMAAVVLVVVELAVLVVALAGVRVNMANVSELFGWAE